MLVISPFSVDPSVGGSRPNSPNHRCYHRRNSSATLMAYFRQYILDKTITVKKVDTKYQRADIMTKALPRDAFEFLQKTITGW